jgi:hypothetical protein
VHNCLDVGTEIGRYDDLLDEVESWACRCPECFRSSFVNAYLDLGLDEVESGALLSLPFWLMFELN